VIFLGANAFCCGMGLSCVGSDSDWPFGANDCCFAGEPFDHLIDGTVWKGTERNDWGFKSEILLFLLIGACWVRVWKA
jgi:hypothetical protein